MSAARRPLSWFEKHDAQIRELAWLGAVAGAPDPSTQLDDGPADASEEQRPLPALSAETEALLAAERAIAESERALGRARAEVVAARDETTAIRGELAAAKEAMTRLSVTMCDDAERELVRLAISVAERVVAREVSLEPELVIAWAREAIAGSALGDQFAIALSTDLSSSIDVGAWEELAPAVTTDASLGDATCELRSGGRVVTVSAEARLGLVGEHIASTAKRGAA